MTAWHAESVERCAELLASDPQQGLSEDEASIRRARYGPNRIEGRAPESGLMRFLRQLREPLIYILLAAGVIALFLGEWIDASVIFGVVLINAIVGATQESRAQAAIAALARRVSAACMVLRAGQLRRIEAGELVPGDVVRVEAGDRVPADLRLFRVSGLIVDEAMLTGESLPVAKTPAGLAEDTVLAERTCIAYAGTHVLQGAAEGLVVATGAASELGRIAQLIEQAPSLATPLMRRLAKFSSQMLVVILALAGLTFVVGLLRGESIGAMLMAAVALAVGAIPEGLPAALTITLAIGVHRMARRAAVIRRLPAVEALGSVTVICSDKTGTLTQNRMTVTQVIAGGAAYRISGVGDACEGTIEARAGAAVDAPALRELLTAGVLCNNASLRVEKGQLVFEGDPTESALLLAALKGGFDIPSLRQAHPRDEELPFDSRWQYMATRHARRVYVKGAVERVLERCSRALDADGNERPLATDVVLAAAENMAAGGLRVLAFAYAAWPDARVLTHQSLAQDLMFIGLQGMIDPPRREAAQAVAKCKAAGIRVVMITGDHAATAGGIAHELGIGGEQARPRVLTGRELAALDDDSLRGAAGEVNVFARVEPEQKLRLVGALQASGEIVAMTGDGVNDAPALKQADIGIAMGQSGTDVAKEAADMVLTDDNFASIEAAVEEGRGVYDNLLKFIVWTLPTNFAEGVIILLAVLIGSTLPITPLQILWINMTTALLLGLTLAFEPLEGDVMARLPRPPREPILTHVLVLRIVLVGALLVICAFGLFNFELKRGASIEYARTAAVNVFVCGEMTYLFNCRSLRHSWWSVGVWSNPWVWFGFLTMLVLQLGFTYLPPMQAGFASTALRLDTWVYVVAAAVLVSGIVGAEKWLRLRCGA
ncbi:MAG: HAD-IC family P-type ATPase [Betaproteobacteria bacterium]|nr:HAD-IC family P-type ATPase [Betaproteobacteria bacterium]